MVRLPLKRPTSADPGTSLILAFSDAPEMDARTSLRWVRGSLPPSPRPAVANAIFDATGVHLRQMPFTPERVRGTLLQSG
jgi:nicotinate dehydrogenase subunit B